MMKIDTASLDPIHRRAVEQTISHFGNQRSENFGLAFAAGFVTALCCAAGWAHFSLGTGLRFGAVSIVVGLIVGLIIRVSGNGWTSRFGYLAAVLSVMACVGGDFWFFAEITLQKEPDLHFLDVVMTQIGDFLSFAFSFSNKSWLFYVIAAFAAYKAGFHE